MPKTVSAVCSQAPPCSKLLNWDHCPFPTLLPPTSKCTAKFSYQIYYISPRKNIKKLKALSVNISLWLHDTQ